MIIVTSFPQQLENPTLHHAYLPPDERRNQEIKKDFNTWDEYLLSVLYNLKDRKNVTRGFTPAEAIFQYGEWKVRNQLIVVTNTPSEHEQRERIVVK